MLNADYLTHDAQSALRRCIELFSNTTRFFLVVENKYKLLKPILSRFCEIYVPIVKIDNNLINLHNYNYFINDKEKRYKELKKLLQPRNISKYKFIDLINLSEKLYNKSFHGSDIINYIEKSKMNNLKKHTLLISYHNICKKLKNEKLLILFLLYFLFIRYSDSLENITFI